jgi:parallel beta-helix repeat protein
MLKKISGLLVISKNVNRGCALRIAVGITTLVLLLAGGVGAATLTVCPIGCTYSSIQGAINAASIGDTVEVHSGTYNENVNVNKRLTLHGIGMPVINDGSMQHESVITLAADGIFLEGFTVASGAGYVPYASINVTSNSNILSRNNVNYGIHLGHSSNNTLRGNNASNSVNGIYLESSNNNLLSENNVSNNNYGIYLDSSSNNTLNTNNILGTAYGISVVSSSNNTLNLNHVSNTIYGIYLQSSSNTLLNENNVSNNNYGQAVIFSIWLVGSSNNMLIANDVNSNQGLGIDLDYSNNNSLIGNNVSYNNDYGVWLFHSNNNTIIGNNASSNNYGIVIESSNDNSVYNNIFNNSNNYKLINNSVNKWNTTKIVGINIIGGLYLGGNFWANPLGTGFSQICGDSNRDGICDSSYSLDSYNIDYLPLAHNSAIPSITGVTITPTTPTAGDEINITVAINNPGASFTGRVEGNMWSPGGTGKYLGWETVAIPNGVSTVTITGAAGGDKSSYISHEAGTYLYDVFLENVDAGQQYFNATDSRLGVPLTVGPAVSVYMNNIVLSASPTVGSEMRLNVTISNPTSSAFTGTMNANIWDSARGNVLTPKSISIAAGGSTTLTFTYTPVNTGLHSYDFFMVSDIPGQNTKTPWGFSCMDYVAGIGFTVV